MEIDVSSHILVAKHEKLSAKEKQALLEQYNISEHQLPKIMLGDPAIVALQAEAGDVIRVTRESQTAGSSYYYRIVIEG